MKKFSLLENIDSTPKVYLIYLEKAQILFGEWNSFWKILSDNI